MVRKLDCVPQFIESSFSYIRSENKKYESFQSKLHPELGTLEMNKQTRYFLGLCNGVSSIKEIIKRTLKDYPSTNYKTVQKDLMNVLYFFWRVGSIEWVSNHPFSTLYYEHDHLTSYRYVPENEVLALCENSELDAGVLFGFEGDVMLRRDYLSQTIFAMKVSFYEMIFSGKVVVRLGLINDDFISTSFTIFFMKCEVDACKLEDFIGWIRSCISQLYSNDNVNISFISESKDSKDVSNLSELLPMFEKSGTINNILLSDGSYADIDYYVNK